MVLSLGVGGLVVDWTPHHEITANQRILIGCKARPLYYLRRSFVMALVHNVVMTCDLGVELEIDLNYCFFDTDSGYELGLK